VFIGGGSTKLGLIVGTVYDWLPDPGEFVSWAPSTASLAKARQAPVSDVPVSNMQRYHLKGFSDFADRGLDYARLVMGSADEPGRCDIRTMGYVINAHLRRHETYHSWFDYKDASHIERHKLQDARDIQMVPTRHGSMSHSEWHQFVLSTPAPTQWDCFRFGIIQREDHFTFFVIVDHLHTDPAFVAVLYTEILMMYRTLAAGKPPIQLPVPASHDAFCIRERDLMSSMTLDSPEVRKWIEFAESNGGSMPDFPLPLGDLTAPNGGDLAVEALLDPQQTAQFEARCMDAGARFSGGLFACAALAQYELTGQEVFSGAAPTDKRKSPAEFMTMGWFTGVIPFSIQVNPSSFEETARAAQASLDANIALSAVPFEHVLELAPWLSRFSPNYAMLNYMDTGLPPLSAVAASQLQGANANGYCDPRSPAYLYTSVVRLFDEVSMMVNYQNNPIARDSVAQYTGAMKSVFTRVADGHVEEASVRRVAKA
jgi:hypothetical protein